MTNNSERAAIVTGASHGIGAAVAERLAHDGFAVTINYSGSEAPARALVDRIVAGGGRAIAVKADVGDPKAVAALFEETERAFGGIDALVNNAGIMKLAPIAECDDALFDQHIAVNLKGVFNCLREGARRIREGGRIVSFSSSVVGLYQPTYGVYAATKAGVEAMTHILAKELGKRQITVNAVAPGPVATKLFLDDKSDEQVSQVTGMIPLGRLGEPDDVASVVSFLVGPDGAWVNGQVLRANGGVVRSGRTGPMAMIALVTGASSGFGQMIARDLAAAGHTAYATMRDTAGKNAGKVEENKTFGQEHGVDLQTIELDVQDERSVAAAVQTILDAHGRLDVLVHNAGHMVYGPSEAFTPEQLAELYDVNVLGTQRVNRAVLPHMRAAGSGLLVWVSSTSVAGGVPPLLGPYFAAKAGMDALAVCYAKELAPLGIETAIVVPGAFTTGTNHFANAGTPESRDIADAYAKAYPDGFADRMQEALAATVPDGADPGAVSRAVVDIVGRTFGERPLRTYVDPASDGAAVTFAVMDRVREQFLHRIGHADLLRPGKT